jgi:hypothetical protein
MLRPPASTAELEVLARRPGRFADESRVVLIAAGGARARGLWFAGRPAAGARPWADLDEADATKLQGELPLDDDHSARTERTIRSELETFLAGTGATQEDRRPAIRRSCSSRRARRASEMLAAKHARSPRHAIRYAREGPRSNRPLPRAQL